MNQIISLINAAHLVNPKQNAVNMIDLSMYACILAKEKELEQKNSELQIQLDILQYAMLVRFWPAFHSQIIDELTDLAQIHTTVTDTSIVAIVKNNIKMAGNVSPFPRCNA